MASEGDKKSQNGWRVKVRNVIKVVSNNRKPSKIRQVDAADTNKASPLKSPKFHYSNGTHSESVTKDHRSGPLMMLDVAESKFGIKPIRKKFRDQMLLIYTLPNTKILLEDLIKISEEKLESESLKKTQKKPAEKNHDTPSGSDESTKNEAIAIGKRTPIAEVICADKINKPTKAKSINKTQRVKTNEIRTITTADSEKGDEISNQIENIDGKDDPKENSSGCPPEPGKEEGARTVSLFSTPLPMEKEPSKGMFFGPHPINLQLDVN